MAAALLNDLAEAFLAKNRRLVSTLCFWDRQIKATKVDIANESSLDWLSFGAHRN